jgi:hypothetical protein
VLSGKNQKGKRESRLQSQLAFSPPYSGTTYSDMGGKVVGARIGSLFYIYAMKSKFLLALVAISVLGVTSANALTGPHGEVLTASKVSGVKAGESITVNGKGFDTTVGIYVELCQIVAAGTLPTVCGGGVNKTGSGAASFWISSNPPAYGRNLAIPFKSGGAFSVALKVQPMIGKIDCRKVSCAIYTRADHTRTQDRTHDLKIPVTFSK